MISVIPLSDTRIYEVIEFIRKNIPIEPSGNENFEDRILYEYILR